VPRNDPEGLLGVPGNVFRRRNSWSEDPVPEPDTADSSELTRRRDRCGAADGRIQAATKLLRTCSR
jgi:hypothetical protein